MTTNATNLISELRELIVAASPDPVQAAPVREIGANQPLDEAIPFSSIIVVGTIVALEAHYDLHVTRAVLAEALDGGVTLAKLARMVEELQDVSRPVRPVG